MAYKFDREKKCAAHDFLQARAAGISIPNQKKQVRIENVFKAAPAGIRYVSGVREMS